MLKEEDGKMEVGGSGRHHVWEDAFYLSALDDHRGRERDGLVHR